MRGIVLVVGGPSKGIRRVLYDEPLVVGREVETGLRLDDPFVSAQHIEVSVRDGQISIRDLGSTNKTYLGGQIVEETHISSSDEVVLGQTTLQVFPAGTSEEKLIKLVSELQFTDTTTGLPILPHFTELLTDEIERARRTLTPLSVMLVNIDHFKWVNTSHKELVGNGFLREVAQRIRRGVGERAHIARCEKDEFAIVMPAVRDPFDIAERVRTIIVERPCTYGEHSERLTVSIGTAVLQDEMATAHFFLDACRENLNHARRAGRNRVHPGRGLFHDPQTTLNQESLKVGKQLRMPERHFRERLAQCPRAHVIAISIDERDTLLARPEGKALVNDLDRGLTAAIATVIRNSDFLGSVEESSVVLVAMPDTVPEVAGAVASQIEEHFDRERVRAGVGAARILLGHSSGTDADEMITTSVAAMSLRQIQASRWSDLPLPIAHAARQMESAIDVVHFLYGLVRLHETLVRWLLALIVASLRHRGTAPSEPTHLRLRATLRERVTLGVWVRLLREATQAARMSGYGERHERLTRALTSAPRGQKATSLQILEEFVAFRNDLFHRGRIVADAIEDEHITWRQRLESVIDSLDVLRQMPPLVVHSIDMPDDDTDPRFRYGVRRLVGDHLVVGVTSLLSQQRMPQGSICIVGSEDGVPLRIDPMVLFARCPRCSTQELFFLDQYDDGQALFRSIRDDHDVRLTARREDTARGERGVVRQQDEEQRQVRAVSQLLDRLEGASSPPSR